MRYASICTRQMREEQLSKCHKGAHFTKLEHQKKKLWLEYFFDVCTEDRNGEQ